MKRKQPEAEIQRALCQHLEARAVPGLVWFAVPNGGARSKIEARIFKGLGVKPGVSDLILFHDGKFYALEVKAPGKTPTLHQIDFIFSMRNAGGLATWVDNFDPAIKVLEQWGLLRGVSQNNRPTLPLATAERV